ncbi:Scramblase-domain-containing protein [Halteromyces radiatus]|uniref:Scramblase-domain-containing protein n=1 Tax=Halteromyces radiatus TaxID=101107 RepID=UPI002220C4E7|nr:Scramblase-domain-containing protein [Halteromyces radiatus]KAI8084487.1 Scramblase-domain-containing protein [Halteromyces radiatus]
MNVQLLKQATRRAFQGNQTIRPALFFTRNRYQQSIQWARYSSLRNPRQLGPRGRIRQHVERQIPSQRVTNNVVQPEQATTTTTTASSLIQQPNPNFSSDPVHTPVYIPEAQDAIVTSSYAGAPVLSQPALVVGRELEMMNIFLGYEQANKYKIMDPNGQHVGYIAEEEGFAKSLSRQFLRTHRRLNATVLDAQGNVIFKIIRPFSWINSRIFIYTSDDTLIGEVQQRWHLLRRKYDLFIGYSIRCLYIYMCSFFFFNIRNTQFATIDTPFLGWDFDLRDEQGTAIANVSRNFVGFAREIFTDSGQYVLRMDAMEGSHGLTLDQRSVMLACAISIDFDYFSRHSSHGSGGFFPMPFFGGGGYENEEKNEPNNDNHSGGDTGGYPDIPQQQQQQQQQQPNEYGDVWMDDEQAGVSSPDDDSWLDTLGEFFKDTE